MKQNRPLSTLFLLAIALFRASSFGEQATSPANPSPPDPLTKQFTILQSVTGNTSLSNGIEIRGGAPVVAKHTPREGGFPGSVRAHRQYLVQSSPAGALDSNVERS